MRARLTFAHVMLADCEPLCPNFLPSFEPLSAAADALSGARALLAESGVGRLRGDERVGSGFLSLRSSSWQS